MADMIAFSWVCKEPSLEATRGVLQAAGLEVTQSTLPDSPGDDPKLRMTLEAAGLHFDQQSDTQMAGVPDILLQGEAARQPLADAVVSLIDQDNAGALILSWGEGRLDISETRMLTAMVVFVDDEGAVQLPPEAEAIMDALHRSDTE